MKKILLYTALTLATSTGLYAQDTPNRGAGVGSDTAPGTGGGNSSSQSSGTSTRSEAGGQESGSAKNADERFIQKAGRSSMMEVKLAEQAKQKASREELKSFSEMIIKDHTAANTELAEIAKTMGVEIKADAHGSATADPSGRRNTAGAGATAGDNDTKDADADRKHMALAGKSGAEFDKAYIQVMKECHAKDISEFEKAQNEVKSQELKGFITKTLPVLRKHASALAAIDNNDSSRADTGSGNSTTPGKGTSGTSGTGGTGTGGSAGGGTGGGTGGTESGAGSGTSPRTGGGAPGSGGASDSSLPVRPEAGR